jgi:glutathione S-transferase
MHDTLPVLYSFRRCPYAMRARLALRASGIAYEHREVVLKNKPAHLLALSPKGTVPVLWLRHRHGHQVLDESLNIMLWALNQCDPQAWLPPTPGELSCALNWIALNDGFFKQSLDRYKYPIRFQLSSGAHDRALGSMFLQKIDAHLAIHGFLHGAHWGIADAAVAPFVRQFARVDGDWFAHQNWSALRKWLDCFETSADYLNIMQKMPLWPNTTFRTSHTL